MLKTSLACVSLLTIFGACSDAPPPTPSAVRDRVAADLPNVLRVGKAAFDGTDQSIPAIGGGASSAMAIARLKYPRLAAALTPAMTKLRVKPADPGTGSGGFDPDAEATWLNDHVFTDANEVEPGIYALPPEAVCSETSVDSSGNETQTIDPDCAAKLAAADVRVRVVDSGARLAFWIQVDANHDEPLELWLEHDGVGATVNLDGAGAALTALAPVFGETAPNVSLAGAVSASLTVTEPATATVTSSIDRDVAIAFADQGVALDGDAAFRFTSAKANVLSVKLVGDAHAGSLALDLGATTAHIPADANVPGDTSTDLDLPGATANVAVADGQPVAITGVSLGDRTTTVKKAGALAGSIDVNPEDGRAFGATVAGDDTGATITVSPKVDVRIFQDHAVLGDDAPTFDVTQYLALGTLATSASSEQVKVVDGAFTVATDPAGYGVSLANGQCAAQDPDSGQWIAAACEF